MKQIDAIKHFSKDCKYTMIKFESKNDEEYGKILTKEEIFKLDLKKQELHRSIDFKNNNKLFTYTIRTKYYDNLVDNPLKTIMKHLNEARIIETVYPNTFNWIFDGISIKACAIISSGVESTNTTLSRYGGTDNFIKILRKHLDNIGKMYRGQSIDTNFRNLNEEIEDTEICIGSINMKTGLFCIPIKLNWTYMDVLKNSKFNTQSLISLNHLEIKYWAREINPDMITEAKHLKISQSINMEDGKKLYPPCIRNLMNLKHKGNLNRFTLATFLLSVHNNQDAKFIYYSVLGDEELEHIKTGNCNSQFRYIQNNIKRYSCPTCSKMRKFCDKSCKLSHPLQEIQNKLEKRGE